jgi:hypothetical protein
VDNSDSLSPSVMKRARMIRVMKTVLAIIERTNQESVRRMARTLADQLVEMMPELRGVNAWHTVGKRRRPSEYGKAAERRLSADFFLRAGD